MAFPVARHRHRVDGVDLVAGAHQRPYEQPPVGLGSYYHVAGLLRIARHQGVEPGHALYAFGEPGSLQPAAITISELYVVMVLSPIMTNEHLAQLCLLSVNHILGKEPRRPAAC